MKLLKIAVLMGGTSREREVSLISGKEVAATLKGSNRYAASTFDPKTDLGLLYEKRREIDLAFIALHGAGGEDGTIQGLLELLRIPYTGSGVLASAIGMDKARSLGLFSQAGLNTPEFRVVSPDFKDFDTVFLPIVIKPNRHGSSLGVSIVRAKKALPQAIAQAAKFDPAIMLQGFIEGVELTVGVVGNEKLESLPVIEIVPVKGEFYDYKAKYDEGGSKHIIPARVSAEVLAQASLAARTAHQTLGCRGFSRTDFIYGAPVGQTEKKLYVLEINTIPGLTPTSLLPDAARAAGIEFGELVERIIQLGLESN